MIDSDACMRVSGCGLVEDARHLFLACGWFGSICGLYCGRGLVLMVWTIILFQITLLSLLIAQVV